MSSSIDLGACVLFWGCVLFWFFLSSSSTFHLEVQMGSCFGVQSNVSLFQILLVFSLRNVSVSQERI